MADGWHFCIVFQRLIVLPNQLTAQLERILCRSLPEERAPTNAPANTILLNKKQSLKEFHLPLSNLIPSAFPQTFVGTKDFPTFITLDPSESFFSPSEAGDVANRNTIGRGSIDLDVPAGLDMQKQVVSTQSEALPEELAKLAAKHRPDAATVPPAPAEKAPAEEVHAPQVPAAAEPALFLLLELSVNDVIFLDSGGKHTKNINLYSIC